MPPQNAGTSLLEGVVTGPPIWWVQVLAPTLPCANSLPLSSINLIKEMSFRRCRDVFGLSFFQFLALLSGSPEGKVVSLAAVPMLPGESRLPCGFAPCNPRL